MSNQTTDQKLAELVKQYKAGIFFGLKGKVGQEVSFLSATGKLNDIILTIVTMANDKGNPEQAANIRSILYSAVLNTMSLDKEYAIDFFDALKEYTNDDDTTNKCKIIDFIPKD